MIICFQEVISLLPLLILCLTISFVLFFIFLFRNHIVTFSITIFGIFLSFISLYLVWGNGMQKVMDLMCIDGFSILCMTLILIASFFSSLVSYIWLSSYYCKDNCDEFYLLLLIFTVGSIVLVNASHVVTLFFAVELVSLPLFGLMGYFYLRKYSVEATVKYLVLSGISTSFILCGIALIYAETTCLSFFNISSELMRRTTLAQSMILIFGIVMISVGFGFKLSLVPFHLWTADVYQGISEIAGMCLSTISKISIFSVLTRFFLLFSESCVQVVYILIMMSCFSIFFGNLMAIKQDNIKRILGYSSISHMGYLLVGVIGSMRKSFDDSYIINLSTVGIESISICLVNYLFATLGVFSILSLFSCFYYNGKEIKEDIGALYLYRGLFWKDPILSIIFTVMMLSLSGIPVTLGFIGKFYLLLLSVQKELWFCIVTIIIGTGIGILYYLRVITIFYLSLSSKSIRNFKISLNKLNYRTILFSFSENYCGVRFVVIVSGIFIVIFSLLLLFFGIYPQSLIFLFSLIQKNF